MVQQAGDGPATVDPAEVETAHHEAAHAVAGFALGLEQIRAVTIVPGDDYLGLCSYALLPATFQPDISTFDDDSTSALLRRHVVATLAGGLAEQRVRGDYNEEGCAGDLQSAVDLASYAVGDQAALQAYVDARWREAEALVRDHWPAIAMLARELLARKSLDGAAVWQLLAAGVPREPA